MATTGSVYIDARMRDERGNVVVMGRALLGGNATIDASSFDLRTLKSITLMPWHHGQAVVAGSIGSLVGKHYRRTMVSVAGSVGSYGQLGNYVRVHTIRMRTIGSFLQVGTWAATVRNGGTAVARSGAYIGTQAGSVRMTYFAAGA